MESPFADLLACMAAFGRALEEKFDPQRFLAEFCVCAQHIVPHDRAVIDYLSDDGCTFTVFAEHAGSGRAVFQGRYTTDFQPDGRYAVDDWDLGPVFAGDVLLVDDVQRDPQMHARPVARARLIEAGVRAVRREREDAGPPRAVVFTTSARRARFRGMKPLRPRPLLKVMSLCICCGHPTPDAMDLCAFHTAGESDGWARGNRLMCNFLHRGIDLPEDGDGSTIEAEEHRELGYGAVDFAGHHS